jgi:hypothetical protein
LRNIKGIVFLLVLANVGYYLYTHGIAAAPFAAQPAPATPSLKLVSETSAPVAPNASSRCVSIGPFSDLAESTHAQGTLRGGGYTPRQRVTEADIPDSVLVYLPLPATATAATELRKKLKTAGFVDAPDVLGPNDATVVSVGSFSDAQRAQVRISQLRQLGLSPQSLERKHGGTAYWLDVDLKSADTALNPADLHTDSGHGAQLEVRDCPAATVPGSPAAGIPASSPPDTKTAASAAR